MMDYENHCVVRNLSIELTLGKTLPWKQRKAALMHYLSSTLGPHNSHKRQTAVTLGHGRPGLAVGCPSDYLFFCSAKLELCVCCNQT